MAGIKINGSKLFDLVIEYGENCAEIDSLDNHYRITTPGKRNGEFYREQHAKSYKRCVDRNELILKDIKSVADYLSEYVEC